VTRETGAPLRSPARVLRLWIKPWEDSDGDLHSPGYVYVPVDVGRWLIDRVPRAERDAYIPIRAPRQRTVASSPPTPTSPRPMPESTLTLRPRSAAAAASSALGSGDDDGQ
jgi:conjugal transfer pilus assembly protein TraV